MPSWAQNLVLIVLLCLAPLYLIILIYLLTALFSKFALQITATHITFHKAIGGTTIERSNILSIDKKIQRSGHENVVITLKNEKQWLSSLSSWKRFLAKATKSMLGYYIYIPTYLLPLLTVELLDLLEEEGSEL